MKAENDMKTARPMLYKRIMRIVRGRSSVGLSVVWKAGPGPGGRGAEDIGPGDKGLDMLPVILLSVILPDMLPAMLPCGMAC